MRGIVSGAMLMAINNLNMRGAFDSVYGEKACSTLAGEGKFWGSG